MKKPATIMLQGTGSDVGKSLLVAGLCRLFTRRGLKVRPFKPQNMSNNAAVTIDGGEIGRAQALQARACGVEPTSDMNPVLLKPQNETGSQVIMQGKVVGTTFARDYRRLKASFLPAVLESFHRLGDSADLVIVEGAGSAAEINLRDGDIANMGFAEAADVPVILVGDIDRGGVIASIVGCHTLLRPDEQRRLAGYLINKFRGDPSLFMPAVDFIAERTGLSSFGIIPWFPAATTLPAEDSQSLDEGRSGRRRTDAGIRIAIPRLPRIANFDDFDPLCAETDVSVDFVIPGMPLPADADLIILPGSKATLADLGFFRMQGWDIDLAAHVRRGGRVLGICGGYQMLGRTIADPHGIEGPPSTEAGLGLLAVDTMMGREKTLRRLSAHTDDGLAITGYEIHMGRTEGPDTAHPFLRMDGRAEGAQSPDGRVAGCYVHGLFASDDFRTRFLTGLSSHRTGGLHYETGIEETLNALADHMEQHANIDALWQTAQK